MLEVRINKYMSEAGYCSRREADRLVEAGRVRINEDIAQMGSKVGSGDLVYVDNKLIETNQESILIAVNKPVGIVCTTTDNQGTNNIVTFLGYNKRIYPVGRLDKDSEGLLLMTNNGDMMDKILRSVNGHEKEYIVTVNKDITDDFIEKMSNGVYLKELDRKTKKCVVKKIDKRVFKIILTQGLNRQIRRMCKEFGYKVVKLKRIRIMNINLGDLKPGEMRNVTQKELEVLNKMLN